MTSGPRPITASSLPLGAGTGRGDQGPGICGAGTAPGPGAQGPGEGSGRRGASPRRVGRRLREGSAWEGALREGL